MSCVKLVCCGGVVPEPGGAVKERGNELCFISFFLWREKAKKDSSSGSENGGGGCMYVCVCVKGSQQLSPFLFFFLIVSSCTSWTSSPYFKDFFLFSNQFKNI